MSYWCSKQTMKQCGTNCRGVSCTHATVLDFSSSRSRSPSPRHSSRERSRSLASQHSNVSHVDSPLKTPVGRMRTASPPPAPTSPQIKVFLSLLTFESFEERKDGTTLTVRNEIL